MRLAPTTLARLAGAALAVALLAGACGDDTGDVADPSGSSADRVVGLTYTTFDGEEASFDEFVGTPTVLNFFAQWCVNCITEMPEFETVAQEMAGEVQFVGISIDKASDDALELVEATGVTYDVGWDPTETLYAHFGGLAMPTTVFIDADGSISRVWSGALDADALRDKINEEIV